MRIRQYAKAIVDLNEAIDINPVFIGAYQSRAVCYIQLKQYDKAISDFIKQGNIEELVTSHAKAIETYTFALNHFSDNADLYYQRGMAYKKDNQPDKAKVDLAKAKELNPEKY